MDEEEDDVRRKGVQRWPSSHLQIKQTETAGRPPLSSNGMLPCRVRVEPTRFLYGNAGLLLLAPPGRSQPPDVVLRQNLRTMDPVAPRPEQSVETLIGQKLQLIGDQFYQEHMTFGRLMQILQPAGDKSRRAGLLAACGASGSDEVPSEAAIGAALLTDKLLPALEPAEALRGPRVRREMTTAQESGD
ncbi:bcl-2-modifying factor isoform X1 [Labeo rohita]|uniref:Bcl-2-modifying factor isoform X1 n=1 Tax=Labeo rohita TaxID=84645 RepID=A0A498M024_LABRO|nr:bcl-2-modifying factor isoform X1 [Labeo rohita]